MATYTITETGNNTTNGLWLTDILNGSNVSGQHGTSTQVAFGDTVKITAGVTCKAPGYGFVLPDLGAGTNTDADYIFIETTALASLTAGRRTNPLTDSAYYATLVNTGSDPALNLTEAGSYGGGYGAHHWKVRGLEIINDGTAMCPQLVSFTISYPSTRAIGLSTHHFNLDRCFVHPKEVTVAGNLVMPLQTSVSKAVQLGSRYATVTNSYVVGAGPFEGYVSGADLVIDGVTNTKVTSATHTFVAGDVGKQVLIIAGTGFTKSRVTINSVEAGAATLSASAGTLGSTGGTWALGDVGSGMAVLAAAGLGDFTVQNNHLQSNYNCLFFGGADNDSPNTATISASSINLGAMTGTCTLSQSANLAVGDWIVFQTTSSASTSPQYTNWHSAKVATKTGNGLTLTLKNGTSNEWSTAPYVTGLAKWNGDTLTNITVSGNYLRNMPAEHAAQSYYDDWNFYPKGWCEIKDGSDFLWEGNVCYSSMGTTLGIYPNNQNGSQPWVDTSRVTVRYNIFDGCKGGAPWVSLNPNYAASQTQDTDLPSDILIEHNVVFPGFQPWASPFTYDVANVTQGGDNVRWLNNTYVTTNHVMNQEGSDPITNGIFRDNIVCSLGNYGFNVSSGTWSASYSTWTITYNVLVDTQSIGLTGNGMNLSATNSVAQTAVSGVGFINTAVRDYRLSGSSPFLTFSSTGGKPGVDWPTLQSTVSAGDWPFTWTVNTGMAFGLDF